MPTAGDRMVPFWRGIPMAGLFYSGSGCWRLAWESAAGEMARIFDGTENNDGNGEM